MVKVYKFLREPNWFDFSILIANFLFTIFGIIKSDDYINLIDHFLTISLIQFAIKYGVFLICFLVYQYFIYSLKKDN